MATGTLKKVVAERGFGFIAAEDGKEYFFHRSGLDATLDFDQLVGGERVDFQVEQSPKGPPRDAYPPRRVAASAAPPGGGRKPREPNPGGCSLNAGAPGMCRAQPPC